MSTRLANCRNCGEPIDPVLPDCRRCGWSIPESDRRAALPEPKQGFYIPWGLFILLGLYFGGVWAYVHFEYYSSPKFTAARELRVANQLLGDDEGRTASVESLHQAMDHLLTALAAFPEDGWAQSRVEVVARRLLERGEKLSSDQQRRVDGVGLKYKLDQDSKRSMFAIGARDLWDVDEFIAMPGIIMRNSVVGGFLIFALWLYKVMQDRKHMHSLMMEREEDRRREMEELARHRTREGKKAKAGRSPRA